MNYCNFSITLVISVSMVNHPHVRWGKNCTFFKKLYFRIKHKACWMPIVLFNHSIFWCLFEAFRLLQLDMLIENWCLFVCCCSRDGFHQYNYLFAPIFYVKSSRRANGTFQFCQSMFNGSVVSSSFQFTFVLQDPIVFNNCVYSSRVRCCGLFFFSPFSLPSPKNRIIVQQLETLFACCWPFFFLGFFLSSVSHILPLQYTNSHLHSSVRPFLPRITMSLGSQF